MSKGETETEGEDKKPGWTAQDWQGILEVLLPYADRFITLKEEEQRHEARQVEIETRWQFRTTISLLAFAAVIVVVMSWLASMGIGGGDALLFLVGLVVGALFGMLQAQIGPARVVVVPEE
ncbi:MAG: hypothetical protein ACE5IJ_04940 [Thermoplasmata archaeon]